MTRIDRVRSRLAEWETDAILVTNEINVRYLTGFTGDSSYLWISQDEAVILSDGRYTAQLAKECPDLAAEIRPPDRRMFDHVASVTPGRGKPVAIEADHLSVSAMDQLSAAAKCSWIKTTGLIAELRMVKDASEIAIIRKAIEIAEESFLAVGWDPALGRATDSMGTERDMAFALEHEMRVRGASGTSFAPIVAVDENGALPHYRPSDRPIAGCQTLLIDWGAMYDGYASDLTRTLHRDRPSDAFADAYRACLAAKEAAVSAVVPGVRASQVDAAARQCLVDAGYGDAFKHSLGHGIGLEIHEGPRLGGKVETLLQEGMVVTIEPGIYLDGEFGIRIEDDVVVTADGAEPLSTRLPTGLDENALIR